jgi:predicted ester cyclase
MLLPPLPSSFGFRILLVSALLACSSARATDDLPLPRHVAVAGDKLQTDASILAARRYAAFWNTGDPAYAKAALAPGFNDPTLPAGRAQGIAGPLQASLAFRTAVPDLSAEISDMVVAGDRVAVHLRLKGHFTGRFGEVTGKGQVIDFQAFDLYRIQAGQIAENWHLEDNLGLMQQMGISK